MPTNLPKSWLFYGCTLLFCNKLILISSSTFIFRMPFKFLTFSIFKTLTYKKIMTPKLKLEQWIVLSKFVFRVLYKFQTIKQNFSGPLLQINKQKHRFCVFSRFIGFAYCSLWVLFISFEEGFNFCSKKIRNKFFSMKNKVVIRVYHRF